MATLKKTVLLAIGLVAVSANVKAQDDLKATVAADVVSQYIWRGQDLGHMSLQPTLGLSYKGLSLTADRKSVV